MRQTAGREAETPHVTHELARFASGIRYEDLPADARFMARQCLLDWLGVTLAGSQEPLALMLRAEAAEEGGAPRATLFGGGARTSMGQAALVNGAAGHALDFDDVLGAMTGHPTAPVAPAALALAEGRGLDGRRVIAGIVAGIEVEARLGRVLGDSHYAKGWHATGTVGAFGAAAAAANMLGLDAEQTARALGIAGTQAAGLKSMFGTMCKPLHAGKAARNGLMAATLAERGFTSRDDVLDCVQGFTDTQTETFRPEALLEEPDRFHILDTLFKYHPACYGTHATIEACLALAENPAFDAGNVERVEVKVPMSALRMCNIPAPDDRSRGQIQPLLQCRPRADEEGDRRARHLFRRESRPARCACDPGNGRSRRIGRPAALHGRCRRPSRQRRRASRHGRCRHAGGRSRPAMGKA